MNKNPYVKELIDLFENIMKKCGKNYSKTASMIERNGKPMARQSLFKMVKGGSLRMILFLEILDAFGIMVEFKKDGELVYKRLPKI